jgi:hypothetical protein
MKRFTISAIVAVFLNLCLAFAQSGAVIPQGGAGHADQASCVILKRMGPADQVTSRLYSFGIRGKQFQYIEGKLPEGFPFHGRLTDHDVRNLQGRGAEVIVVNQNYTSEELKQARADCRGETGKTPLQSEAKSAPPSTSEAGTTKEAFAAENGGSGSKNLGPAAPVAAYSADSPQSLSLSSNPDGAEVYVDHDFIGNTPAVLKLKPGKHNILVKMSGYKDWSRTVTAQPASEAHMTALLEK